MNDALEALRARFRERARADADKISRAIYDGDYEVLEQVVHGLAGAAGLFGYPALSEYALAIDAEFEAGNKPSDEALNRLIEIIRAESDLYS